jgi:hypothetical protein
MNGRDDRGEAYASRKADRSSPLDRPMTVVVVLGVFAVVIAALLLIT